MRHTIPPLKAALYFFVLTLFFSSMSFNAAAEITPPAIGGEYKNLLTVSQTQQKKDESLLHLQRLRFKVNQEFTPELDGTLIYDNEMILNNFSDSPDFAIIREKDQRRLAFWDMDEVFFDEEYFYWKHALYRAYMHYFTPSFQATVGKQSIDWSRMRFYHPLDLFNPISPLDIEKSEKPGVDAINLEFSPQSFTQFNFIYAPYRNREKQGLGGRFQTKIQDYDISLLAAEIHKDRIVGAGFDGYIANSGFRGELSFTSKDNKDQFFRSSVGLDHSLTPKLYGIVEYFYNGGAKLTETQDFLSSYRFSRKAMSVTKHIVGAGLEYDISGTIKASNHVFYDFGGVSSFLNPELKWNIKPNFDLSFGAHFFEGDADSEYGNYQDLFYAEMKLFF